MHRAASILFVVGSFVLAGCGSTTEDRAISGGGIGAGAGAIVGAVTGLSVVEGALIGAGVGAATGALTDESQVNLGDPIWKKHAANKPLVRDVQFALSDAGYNPGPADGLMGAKTTAAIRAYQNDHNLVADGHVSPELLQHIRANS